MFDFDEVKQLAHVCLFVFIVLFILFAKSLFTVTMAESPSKTRKYRRNTNPNQCAEVKTSVARNVVNANWMTFLTSLTDEEKNPPPENGVGQKAVRQRKKRVRKRNINSSIAAQNITEKADQQSEVNGAKADRKPTLTKYIAMDCEMVGIGEEGKDSMLARVSLVNVFGDSLYDKFVQPREPVVDYRTSISGVRPEDVLNGESFQVVQEEVADLLKGRILVGHAIKHDLEVLFLSHPKRSIRDTSKYKPFRKINRGGTPSLKKLATELLGVQIQKGEHSSVEDARAAMQLYSQHSKQWETSVAARDRRYRPVKTQEPLLEM